MSTAEKPFSTSQLVNALRLIVAAVLAAAFIALVRVLAAFLTRAARIASGVALLGAGAWWLYRKVRGRSAPGRGPTVLVARRGPHGWTVDGEDQPRGA